MEVSLTEFLRVSQFGARRIFIWTSPRLPSHIYHSQQPPHLHLLYETDYEFFNDVIATFSWNLLAADMLYCCLCRSCRSWLRHQQWPVIAWNHKISHVCCGWYTTCPAQCCYYDVCKLACSSTSQRYLFRCFIMQRRVKQCEPEIDCLKTKK